MAEAGGPESSPQRRPMAPPPPPRPPILRSYYFRRSASQRRLHNFSFPSLSWGKQRLLGRTNHSSTPAADEESRKKRRLSSSSYSPAPASASLSPSRLEGPRGKRTPQKVQDRVVEAEVAVEEDEKEEEEQDEGLEKFKRNMLSHFRHAVNRIKLPPSATEEAPYEASKPWNLRLRRAACKAPKNGRWSHQSQSPSLLTPEKNSGRLKPEVAGRMERPKFSPVLSREEIEEDFVAMTGSKPPRRPKKRPKSVQRQLDMLYPGFWLIEVTADTYKIP